jgi:decaprenylphospho-beta-D-erythro-pentofuranosid-2-ulose 2-reductase
MKNGVGVHQSIVLFGGTSDIGVAILREVLQPGVARVVLVSRDVERAEIATQELSQSFPEVDFFHIRWDAADASSMHHVVAEVVSVVSDIDVAIVSQGLLNEGYDYFADPSGLVEMANVNFTGTMSLSNIPNWQQPEFVKLDGTLTSNRSEWNRKRIGGALHS